MVFHAQVAGDPPRVLTLYLDPQAFQDIVTRFPDTGRGVPALADRNGRFLAGSMALSQRVGRPGSVYLRRAVPRGGARLYHATTLEGVQTYTARATSALTGWSAHVAVQTAAIDSPRTWANSSVAAGLIAALLLAAGLTLFALYETRRRRMEEPRLVGMQKAEAISRFTGTLAHDFRNLLSVIDAGVRLILPHTQEDATTKRASAIGDAVARGNRLVSQLLSLVRSEGAHVEALGLGKCIGGADELLAGSLGAGIEFRWHVEEDAPHACGNADQLELAYSSWRSTRATRWKDRGPSPSPSPAKAAGPRSSPAEPRRAAALARTDFRGVLLDQGRR